MRSSSTPDAPDRGAAEPAGASLAAKAEAKAAFHLRMRARGVQDLAVLRAFEVVPRAFFVAPAHRGLAARGLPVPIACGQTLPEPWLVARMIEALRLADDHRILEIGVGTGYATAILSLLASDVLAVERFQGLALAAEARLADLGIANAAVLWADGLALAGEVGVFDRILVHGQIDGPAALLDRLTPGGVLVCARAAGAGQAIVRIEKDAAGAVSETVVCSCRLQPMVAGVAAAS